MITDAEGLARALGGKRSGRQWSCRCPAHPDKDPSLIVYDGREAVQVRCLAGCEPADVIAVLKRRGLWPERVRTRLNSQSPPDDHHDLAMAIWAEARPALGTGVEEVYLSWRRGLFLDGLPRQTRARILTEVIRFHPRCPCGRERMPALVALMRSLKDDRPRAIQRIYLDAHWHKLGARMLGPVAECAIKLQGLEAGCLTVTEGLETGLGCLLLGDCGVWVLGSAGAIERLAVLDGVQHLVVRADRDRSGTGQRAAAICLARWRAAGRTAEATIPQREGRDYADVAAQELA